MEIKFIYVVYGIEENDLSDLMIFDEHWKAKEYVEKKKKEGIDLMIWQRPIE